MTIFLWSLGFICWVSLAILINCNIAINGLVPYKLELAENMLLLLLIVTVCFRYLDYLYKKMKWLMYILYLSLPFLVAVVYSTFSNGSMSNRSMSNRSVKSGLLKKKELQPERQRD